MLKTLIRDAVSSAHWIGGCIIMQIARMIPQGASRTIHWGGRPLSSALGPRQYIILTNPLHRFLSIVPTMNVRGSANPLTLDKNYFAHAMMQTPSEHSKGGNKEMKAFFQLIASKINLYRILLSVQFIILFLIFWAGRCFTTEPTLSIQNWHDLWEYEYFTIGALNYYFFFHPFIHLYHIDVSKYKPSSFYWFFYLDLFRRFFVSCLMWCAYGAFTIIVLNAPRFSTLFLFWFMSRYLGIITE